VHHDVGDWHSALANTSGGDRAFLRLCRAHTWYNNILPPVFRDAERQIAKEQAVLDAREHTRRYNSVRANSKFMPSLPGPASCWQSRAINAPWSTVVTCRDVGFMI